MVASEENLLGTPSGYATPDQLKGVREYAKALLQGNLQQPVQHWSQGVSNMVSALVGGNMAYNAGKQENEANAVEGGRLVPTIGGASAPGPLADAGGASNAIAGIESGGRYDKLGPITKTGDRAYGKYQVMGNNIPEWTQASLGKSMTPEEFRASPEAQEAVFKNKFGEYTKKYGPEGAARAWFAGEGGMNDLKRSDQLGTTVASYGKRFAQAYGAEGGTPSKAVAAVSSALRNEPPSEAGVRLAASGAKPVAKPQMGPDGSGIFYDPALIKRPPQYNEGQIRGIMGSPRISDAMKAQALQAYQAQGQPIVMPWPGGQVIIDPNDPSRQQFVAKEHWGESKIGDISGPKMYIPTGRGAVDRAPVTSAPVGPRSDAGPVPGAAPAAAPEGGPVPGAVPAPVMAQNASTAPAGPSEGTIGVAPLAPESGPVKVASLDPTAGVTTAAAAPLVAPVQSKTPAPLTKMVQAAPPPGVDADDWNAYQQKKAFDVKTAVDEDAQKKGAESAIKKYDTLSTQAAAARKQMPNLDYGLALLNDPNIYQGIMSNEVTAWKKVKAAFPGLFGEGAQYAAAPNEVFNKVISGSILDSMKTALGGLGQVRVAEIDLLKQANASNQNTPAANRALLELSRRAVQSVDHLDEIGQQYASGDQVVDPIDGKVLLKANVDKNGEMQPRRGLDVGYDKLARKFVTDHPTMSAEDVKNYKTIFDTGKDPRRPDPDAPTKAGASDFKIGQEKQFKQGTGVWDGKQWVPKGK